MNRNIKICLLLAAFLALISGQTLSSNSICVDAFFNAPFTGPTVQIHDPNDGSGNLYALYLDGRLVAFNKTSGAAAAGGPTLTLNAAVGTEKGAYSFILHPQFATNRRAFFYYTCDPANDATCYATCEDDDWCNGGTCNATKACESGVAEPLFIDLLEEWNLPTNAAAFPVKRITTVPFRDFIQGGALRIDGSTIYLGTGDGSTANDTYRNSQDINRTAGKLLAFDIDSVVENPLPGRNASAASGNPFTSVSKFPEIYAIGLRQPYKIIQEGSFVLVSDIGESLFEEINAVVKGANYGWPAFEGPVRYLDVELTEDGSIPTLPLAPVNHTIYPYPGPIALMLGGVYGGADTRLSGKFFIADFGGAIISANLQNSSDYSFFTIQCALNTTNPCNTTQVNIFDLSKDASGEFYFSTAPGGVFKTVPASRCITPNTTTSTSTSSIGSSIPLTSATRTSAGYAIIVSISVSCFALIMSLF